MMIRLEFRCYQTREHSIIHNLLRDQRHHVLCVLRNHCLVIGIKSERYGGYYDCHILRSLKVSD